MVFNGVTIAAFHHWGYVWWAYNASQLVALVGVIFLPAVYVLRRCLDELIHTHSSHLALKPLGETSSAPRPTYRVKSVTQKGPRARVLSTTGLVRFTPATSYLTHASLPPSLHSIWPTSHTRCAGTSTPSRSAPTKKGEDFTSLTITKVCFLASAF